MKKQENIPLTKKYIDEHEQHLREKVAMRNAKERDKSNTNDETFLVIFDLENVITLPRADVSGFFLQT